jgi:hypothetical protein
VVRLDLLPNAAFGSRAATVLAAGKYLINTILAEKAELHAELPSARARRAKVIRKDIAACDSLIRRYQARPAS